MAEPFLAEIRLFSFSFAPKGWAACDGQLLAINQNQALFALIGTQYGGDGRITFALPDLRGRVPLHRGWAAMGEAGGSPHHTLTLAEMAAHTHSLSAVAEPATEVVPGDAFARSVGEPVYSTDASALVPFAADAVGPAGLTQAHENRQPFGVINFCIALQGIFPSQT